MMSIPPRKAITQKKVANSDHQVLQPTFWWNQKKTTGLVTSATAVAARISRRHWEISSVVCSARERPSTGSATVAIEKV